MRVMVIVYTGDQGYEAGRMPEPYLLERMGKFNDELRDAGMLIDAAGLRPSRHAIRIDFPTDAKAEKVTNGPFTERLVAGFWIWEVDSVDTALDWAKRAPMEAGATLEIRPFFTMEDFA